MIIKVSDFLKSDVDPFVLGCFFSRTIVEKRNQKNYLYTYTTFGVSKYGNDKSFDYEKYIKDGIINDLNKISYPKNWLSHDDLKKRKIKVRKRTAYYLLENDLGVSLNSFFNKIYFKLIELDFTNDDNFNSGKRDFIRGFIETRGSIDSFNYISSDYFFNSSFELKKVRILTEKMNVPSNVINLNFRNLQKQFREGKKRNTQLRINIHWYASKIGFINKYKSYLYKVIHNNTIIKTVDNIDYFSNKLNPPSDTINIQFSKYLDLYSEHIIDKKLSKKEINDLREKLNFDSVSKTNSSRNQSIIDLFVELSDDKCASCGTTVTSTNKKTGRQNFDIHHYIPLANDPKALDHIDNLVKLCPTCHASLRKGRALIQEQVKINYNIIKDNDGLYDFVSSYLDIYDKNEISTHVQKLLL